MKARENELLTYINNRSLVFHIPPYQRNYEWTEEQCEVFFNDVMKVLEASYNSKVDAGHFFGTIVVTKECCSPYPDKITLIDGQQRITTTMLFMLAIRDLIEDEDLKCDINESYLINNHKSNQIENKIRLEQVEHDWETYKNLIIGKYTDCNESSQVYKNYIYFKKKLEDVKNIKKYPLVDIINKSLSKFSIVDIELQPDKYPWEMPQDVFETMNSLGKPLDLSDLIRNYLLLNKSIDEQKSLYHTYWMNLEKHLSNNLSKYFRDFMQMKECHDFLVANGTNAKKLYRSFKDIFSNVDTTSLIIELSNYSTLYSYIICGEYPNPEIEAKLSILRYIGFTTGYSFLLSLLVKKQENKLNNNDLLCILDVLIVWLLRRRICSLTDGENKTMPSLTKYVEDIITTDNKKSYMFDLMTHLPYSCRFPNDKEVSDALRQINFYEFDLNKLLLILLEYEVSKIKLDFDDDTIQLEHIYPQKAGREWEEGKTSEEIEKLIEKKHSLGNITIIIDKHNQSIGNKPFDDKKKIYTEFSGLQLSRKFIIDKNKWGLSEIEERTNELIGLFIGSILSIPEKYSKTNNYKEESKKSKKPNIDLIKLGLKDKYIVSVVSDSLMAKVISKNKLEFEGKEISMSGLAKELDIKYNNHYRISGAYRGGEYFTYEGKYITDLWSEYLDNIEEDEE